MRHYNLSDRFKNEITPEMRDLALKAWELSKAEMMALGEMGGGFPEMDIVTRIKDLSDKIVPGIYEHISGRVCVFCSIGRHDGPGTSRGLTDVRVFWLYERCHGHVPLADWSEPFAVVSDDDGDKFMSTTTHESGVPRFKLVKAFSW